MLAPQQQELVHLGVLALMRVQRGRSQVLDSVGWVDLPGSVEWEHLAEWEYRPPR